MSKYGYEFIENNPSWLETYGGKRFFDKIKIMKEKDLKFLNYEFCNAAHKHNMIDFYFGNLTKNYNNEKNNITIGKVIDSYHNLSL